MTSVPLLTHRTPLSSICGRFKGAALMLVRRIPFISSFFICLVLAGIVAGATRSSYHWGTEEVFRQTPPAPNGVVIIGRGLQFDLTSKKLTISWNIMGCGTYELKTDPTEESGECDVLDRAADIYFNGETTPTFSYDPGKLPLTSTNDPLYIGATCTFEKNHDIDISYQGAIPFDWYGFGASILVMEKATNKSVPITAFAVIGRLDNFVASSTEIPTQSKFTYDSGTGTTTVLVESSVISVVVERVQLAKAFTACLFIVNWALTIGSVYITLLTLVGTGKMDPAVVLLPITLVLTIPTLRGLYVGSPPFGTYIDTFGFFLQMVIVAVSSMILLYRVVSKPVSTGQVTGDEGKT